jgi:hypothetical protein
VSFSLSLRADGFNVSTILRPPPPPPSLFPPSLLLRVILRVIANPNPNLTFLILLLLDCWSYEFLKDTLGFAVSFARSCLSLFLPCLSLGPVSPLFLPYLSLGPVSSRHCLVLSLLGTVFVFVCPSLCDCLCFPLLWSCHCRCLSFCLPCTTDVTLTLSLSSLYPHPDLTLLFTNSNGT